MNRLPGISWQGLIWRLPLSRQTQECFVSLLLNRSEVDAGVTRLANQLRQDPALFCFAALWRPTAPRTTVQELASGLAASLPTLLAQAAEPVAGSSAAAWDSDSTAAAIKLWRRFSKLPIERWLPAAAPWLSLVGPPAPAAWRESWPEVEDPAPDTSDRQPSSANSAALGTPDYRPGSLDLVSLARQTNRLADWERRFEQELKVAKLAAVQQLAYGLSHEINNPLANISTRAQLLIRDERDPVRSQGLTRIIEQTTRAHEMVADLMFYARPPQPDLTEFDPSEVLSQVVRESSEVARGRGIVLQRIDSASDLRVRADRGMLTEAIRALVRNSLEAIVADGRILLSCEHLLATSRRSPEGQAAPPTAQAWFRVRDSGPGLDELAAKHAFDPYFCGRESGRGLGIGLCRASRIAELHGGQLTLSTGPIGCTASLRIPLQG